MKTILLFLMFMILAGCRERVYWLSGLTDIGKIDCAVYPELLQSYELLQYLDQVLYASTQTLDLEELRYYRREVESIVEKLKKDMPLLVMIDVFPVRYQWKLPKTYTGGSTVHPQTLTVNGIELPVIEIHQTEDEEHHYFSVERRTSILEACVFSKTMQALVTVKNGDRVLYHYRFHSSL